MEKICVYTCITGNYDNVNEIKNKEKGIDYYLFTNNKNIKSDTWNVVYIEDSKLDNQRLSRKIKMLGHPVINDKYDISVWMDASVIWLKSVKDFVKEYLKENNFATFKHSFRDDIYVEAYECIKMKKDTKENVVKHIEFLRKEGYPENNGLCEMTVFIKRHKDKTVQKTMKLWFDTVCKYSKRDQLSFMYCVWKTGLKLDIIPLSVWDNEWFTNAKHNFKKEITTSRIYYGNDMDFTPDRFEEVTYNKKDETYSYSTKVLDDCEQIEIELSDVPVVEYKNLKVDGVNLTKVLRFNTIDYNDKNIFYTKSGMIRLEGNFKKGDKIKISVELHKLTEAEVYEFVKYITEREILDSLELQKKRNEIRGIKNSKGWRLLTKLRKLKK